MKNILRAIVEYLNNDYPVHVVFVFVILVGLIVGITKNWKAIQRKALANIFLIFLFIVVAFFIVNGQYIKCSVGLLLMS